MDPPKVLTLAALRTSPGHPVGVARRARWTAGARRRSPVRLEFHRKQERNMLTTIALVLIVLWILGLVTSYTMGGFIHILLVVAIIAVLVRVIQGRRVL